MKNLTVIIPIVEVDEKLLTKAIKSITEQKPKSTIKTLLVYPSAIEDEVSKLKLPSFVVKVKNLGGTSFAEQINFGVEMCDTEYFTVLEFDDEFSNIYFKNVKSYIKEQPETGMFLPITAEIDVASSHLLKLSNDFVWSKNFIKDDEFGYVTHEILGEFSYFFISGAVIKRSDFLEVGKLKSKFDVTCVYEFFLRMTYNDKKIFVIPRMGYMHLVNREGSATKQFSVKYNKKDIETQYEEAKKDFMFN